MFVFNRIFRQFELTNHFPGPGMDGKNTVCRCEILFKHRKNAREVFLDIDVARPVQSNKGILFLLNTESLSYRRTAAFSLKWIRESIITLPTKKTFESGIPSLRKFVSPLLSETKRKIRNRIRNNAIDLFRHRAVEAAKPRFHMSRPE